MTYRVQIITAKGEPVIGARVWDAPREIGSPIARGGELAEAQLAEMDAAGEIATEVVEAFLRGVAGRADD